MPRIRPFRRGRWVIGDTPGMTVNTKTVRFVALLFGFAAAGFGLDAGAQTEVKAKDRDAAIEKCIARARP